ncbi:MAG: hypothetical protein HUJ55_05180 [Ileibacterium sp.]|nr:hypothetical protein [Ileibacterium sp.]
MNFALISTICSAAGSIFAVISNLQKKKWFMAALGSISAILAIISVFVMIFKGTEKNKA